jgi:hypothetical protein
MSLMKAAIRIILILGGTVFCVVAAGALFLVMREGQPQDRMVAKSVSPDGRRILELHQVIAPVHGGADHLQITIGDAAASFGDVVFSQKFEYSDFKTFRIWWTDSTHANFRYGPCDTGHAEDRPMNPQPSSVLWKDVTLALDDSGRAVTQ